MSNVNVYKQRPDSGRAESPLFHAGLDEMARKGKSSAGVILREKKLLGHPGRPGHGLVRRSH